MWCGFCWHCHSTGHTQRMGKRGGILLLCFSMIWVTQEWGRQIVQVQDGLYSRMSFIFMYETSTLTPFVKPCDILNLAIRNIFYIQLYVESAFMYNPGSTVKTTCNKQRACFQCWLQSCFHTLKLVCRLTFNFTQNVIIQTNFWMIR